MTKFNINNNIKKTNPFLCLRLSFVIDIAIVIES